MGAGTPISLLLLLANFDLNGTTQPIDVKFSQETLAEMIGTTRSRVSHFMNKFRKLGFMSYNGTIEIHRSPMNAVLHDKISTRKPGALNGQRTRSSSTNCVTGDVSAIGRISRGGFRADASQSWMIIIATAAVATSG